MYKKLNSQNWQNKRLKQDRLNLRLRLLWSSALELILVVGNLNLN